MSKLLPRFQFMGRTRFRLELLAEAGDARLLEAGISCLCCGGRVVARPYEPHAVFRVGRELLGICCPSCLAPDTRGRLERLKAGVR